MQSLSHTYPGTQGGPLRKADRRTPGVALLHFSRGEEELGFFKRPPASFSPCDFGMGYLWTRLAVVLSRVRDPRPSCNENKGMNTMNRWKMLCVPSFGPETTGVRTQGATLGGWVVQWALEAQKPPPQHAACAPLETVSSPLWYLLPHLEP